MFTGHFDTILLAFSRQCTAIHAHGMQVATAGDSGMKVYVSVFHIILQGRWCDWNPRSIYQQCVRITRISRKSVEKLLSFVHHVQRECSKLKWFFICEQLKQKLDLHVIMLGAFFVNLHSDIRDFKSSLNHRVARHTFRFDPK